MNYTSIEQSKHLLELGLNPHTSDCYWEHAPGYVNLDGEMTGYFDEPGWGESGDRKDLPCWSIGALLELMPGGIKPAKDDFILNIGGEDKFHHVAYDFQGVEESFQYFQGTLLEAAYNMIIWLLENNYIEKGE